MVNRRESGSRKNEASYRMDRTALSGTWLLSGTDLSEPYGGSGQVFRCGASGCGGTYCLFSAGSIALLKLLKSNKRYYYQTRHFTSISECYTWMKQNAIGLANICILSPGVLLVISTTSCLWFGQRRKLSRQDFPSDSGGSQRHSYVGHW